MYNLNQLLRLITSNITMTNPFSRRKYDSHNPSKWFLLFYRVNRYLFVRFKSSKYTYKNGLSLVKNVHATEVALKSANLRRLAPFYSGLNVGPAALYGHSALHGPAAHIKCQSQCPEKCHFTPFIAIFFGAENINFFSIGMPLKVWSILSFGLLVNVDSLHVQ